jgi:3-deoxy-7-phosphoheptulonate synthase
VSRDSKRETFWILRKAGQFAKPRSSATEIVGDMRLESFRGDIVNERRPDPRGRSPNPIRMAHAYGQALVTLELARQWRAASHRDRFVPIAHEALLLPYDLALTATGDDNNAACCGAAHMLWIGNRTRDLDGPHLAFAAGLCNPVGIKVGPGMDPQDVRALARRLSPEDDAGKLLFIGRLGAERIEDELPALIAASKVDGRRPIWICDPMHGNAEKLPEGTVTRRLANILREISLFGDICRAEGVAAGGLHLEMSGEDVTECLDDDDLCTEVDLAPAYLSAMDPRLNRKQALRVVTAFAKAIAA